MKINSRFAKTTVAAALVVATGAATLGITSFVSAEIQDQENTTVAVAQHSTAADDSVSESSDVAGRASSSGAPATTDDESSPAKRRSPIAVAATALDMSEADLVAELKAGKSIADVASAKGVALDTVVDALYADLKTHVDAHVAEGKITQTQADARLAGARTRITAMVNMAGPLRDKGRGGDGDRMGHRGGPRFVTESLAKALGMTVDELKAEVKSGKTLAQIAEGKNVSVDALKKQLLAEFSTRLDDIVNGVRPMKDMGGRGEHGDLGGHDDN